jgi:hypothetical protein
VENHVSLMDKAAFKAVADDDDVPEDKKQR